MKNCDRFDLSKRLTINTIPLFFNTFPVNLFFFLFFAHGTISIFSQLYFNVYPNELDERFSLFDPTYSLQWLFEHLFTTRVVELTRMLCFVMCIFVLFFSQPVVKN
ncbi:hypothetical protein BJ742DRAFT_805186 [Cladochytrium replicatum]|nr:hypothetical protein BJ742DRAFT_805186 [Cladochytrium replicatum]